jgi:glucose/arabinose dehydrogenase
MSRKLLQLLILFSLLIIVSFILINISLKNKTNTTSPSSVTPSVPTTETKDRENIPLLTTIAENLEVPWALAFLPDGSILVTERAGRVRIVHKDGNLSPNPVAKIEDVKQIGEGGLHGITLHPDFTNNHFVYVYYTYGQNIIGTQNRVVRFRYDQSTLIEKTIIVDMIPGALFHDGGRIKFGPDKMLYITTGDAQNPSLAQDINSLAGKILRVTDSGKPSLGNPFSNLVYSYGHRNPQGITWDSLGRLWATEHGQSAKDELNLIDIGKNYGWPIIQGDEQKLGLETPILNSGADTWAPAGLAFINDSLFFAGLRGQALYETVIKNGQVTELKTHFKGEFGRIREVIVGPDNMLYITTSNRDGRGNPNANDDKIIKVNPTKL